MANKNVWVLVETVSMYRMRYVIECPADHPEYALDTVTSDNAKEFSQNHIGLSQRKRHWQCVMWIISINHHGLKKKRLKVTSLV